MTFCYSCKGNIHTYISLGVEQLDGQVGALHGEIEK